MKRITNRRTVDAAGLIQYAMERVLPDGRTLRLGRVFPQPMTRSHKAWCLREMRRDLKEMAKPEAERWFKTDDSLPTSGVLVEAEMYGGIIIKLSYRRGFWYYDSGRLSHHGRPSRWRYMLEAADA